VGQPDGRRRSPALIARLAQEGKLRSHVESKNELVLTLLRPKSSFDGYEAGAREVVVRRRRHHEHVEDQGALQVNRGSIPSRRFREPLERLIDNTTGDNSAPDIDRRWTVLLALTGVALLVLGATAGALNILGGLVAGRRRPGAVRAGTGRGDRLSPPSLEPRRVQPRVRADDSADPGAAGDPARSHDRLPIPRAHARRDRPRVARRRPEHFQSGQEPRHGRTPAESPAADGGPRLLRAGAGKPNPALDDAWFPMRWPSDSARMPTDGSTRSAAETAARRPHQRLSLVVRIESSSGSSSGSGWTDLAAARRAAGAPPEPGPLPRPRWRPAWPARVRAGRGDRAAGRIRAAAEVRRRWRRRLVDGDQGSGSGFVRIRSRAPISPVRT
jgi:hypothetical protein